MEQSSPGTLPSVGPPEDRLNSWKEIAAHFNRDVTTVERWEKREGMPVHRHLHDRMGSVYASRAELDSWARGRSIRAAQENGSSAPVPSPPEPAPRPAPSRLRITWRLMLPLAAVSAALAIGSGIWLEKKEYLWRNPIDDSRFQLLTDFDGVEQAAAVSRDGQFVAFLSNRDGQMDVWVTQAGSGEFHNLTRGSATDLVNPQLRCLGFSPDGSVVTFWNRTQSGSGDRDINIWAVPTLGGVPRPYLEAVSEFDWSHDASRLVYQDLDWGTRCSCRTATSARGIGPSLRPLPGSTATFHCGLPTAHSSTSCGAPPDKLDIWRITPAGGTPERITSHNARVSHPVLLDRRTLMYLASAPMDPARGFTAWTSNTGFHIG